MQPLVVAAVAIDFALVGSASFLLPVSLLRDRLAVWLVPVVVFGSGGWE